LLQVDAADVPGPPVLFALPAHAAGDVRLAQGVAATIFEGLCEAVLQYDQLDRLQQAAAALLPMDAPIPTLTAAAGGRTVARVTGKQLLDGAISPSEWASAAVGEPAAASNIIDGDTDDDEDDDDDNTGAAALLELHAQVQEDNVPEQPI
jgi:hypothetical protein